VEGRWLVRLARLHPGDVGVLCALFLNLVELRPGEALYLPAGNLHAYLEGAGVEIMASSDNVLRGGLTPKPVNVPELLRVLRFDEIDPTPLHAAPVGGGEHVYATAAEEFELSFIDVDAEDTVAPPGSPAWGAGGPEIWLASEGHCRLTWAQGALELARGASAFVPAGGPAFTLGGRGRLFRARVPGVA
jgi:mannose-6-phosphate isomerase